MSDESTNPAEPTENQPGGSTSTTTSGSGASNEATATAPAEPTENQPGG